MTSQYSLSDATYGKITYRYKIETEISIPRYEPTADSYPYIGKGFTVSKNVILPEWKQAYQDFREDDLLEVIDSKTGQTLEPYKKTVIDTDILPLIKVKEMALEAFVGRSFYRTPGGQLYINGTSINGVRFEGWIDLNTGKLKTFYPVETFKYDY